MAYGFMEELSETTCWHQICLKSCRRSLVWIIIQEEWSKVTCMDIIHSRVGIIVRCRIVYNH